MIWVNKMNTLKNFEKSKTILVKDIKEFYDIYFQLLKQGDVEYYKGKDYPYIYTFESELPLNGVTQEFLDEHNITIEDYNRYRNNTNRGCFNCWNCMFCSRCIGCEELYYCWYCINIKLKRDCKNYDINLFKPGDFNYFLSHTDANIKMNFEKVVKTHLVEDVKTWLESIKEHSSKELLDNYVTQDFLDKYSITLENYEAINQSNKNCFNCWMCENCINCWNCDECDRCENLACKVNKTDVKSTGEYIKEYQNDIIKYFGNNEDIKFIFYRFETLSNEQWESGKVHGKDERELNNTQKTLLLQSAIMKQMVRFTRYYGGDFSLNEGFETSKLFLDFLESKLSTDMKDIVSGIKEIFNIDFYYAINEIYVEGRTNWDHLLEYHGTPNFKHSLSAIDQYAEEIRKEREKFKLDDDDWDVDDDEYDDKDDDKVELTMEVFNMLKEDVLPAIKKILEMSEQ